MKSVSQFIKKRFQDFFLICKTFTLLRVYSTCSILFNDQIRYDYLFYSKLMVPWRFCLPISTVRLIRLGLHDHNTSYIPVAGPLFGH